MARNLYMFDCFGVVLREVSNRCMKGRLNEDQQRYMREEVFRSVDLGEMEMEQIFNIVSDKFGVDRVQFRRDWKNSEEVQYDTVRLIDELRGQGHCVVLLSNASAEYVEELFTRFDLFRHFDKVFVSSAFHVAKPDPAFFKLCLNSFDEQFDRVYFTDDNALNLVNAESVGITPVLFTTAEEVKKQLIK